MKINRKDRGYYKTIITTQQLKSKFTLLQAHLKIVLLFYIAFFQCNLQAFEVSCTCKKLFIEYRRERAKNILVRKRLELKIPQKVGIVSEKTDKSKAFRIHSLVVFKPIWSTRVPGSEINNKPCYWVTFIQSILSKATENTEWSLSVPSTRFAQDNDT